MKLFATAILAQSSVAIRMQSKASQDVSDDPYRSQAFDVASYDTCIAAGQTKTLEMREKCDMIRQCRDGCDEQYRLIANPDWLIYDTCNVYCEAGASTHPAYGWCQSQGDEYQEIKNQRCRSGDEFAAYANGRSFFEIREADPEGSHAWCVRVIAEENQQEELRCRMKEIMEPEAFDESTEQ